MASLNKVMLIGRLTDNPEPPFTFSGTGNKVVKFRFAVGRSRKNQQTGQWENDPNPLYIDCEAFSRDNFTRLVDVITNYCRKGSQVYIEGQLKLDTWDDKQTGQKRSKHKIVVDNIELLDRAGSGEGEAPSSGAGQSGGYAPRSMSQSAPSRSAPPPSQGGYRDEPSGHDGNPDDIPF